MHRTGQDRAAQRPFFVDEDRLYEGKAGPKGVRTVGLWVIMKECLDVKDIQIQFS